jgi:hypothetical protein
MSLAGDRTSRKRQQLFATGDVWIEMAARAAARELSIRAFIAAHAARRVTAPSDRWIKGDRKFSRRNRRHPDNRVQNSLGLRYRAAPTHPSD